MCLLCFFVNAGRASPEIIQKRKDAAALKIQRIFRGYLVRRTRPMKHLLIVQSVKRELARLKIQVWNPKRVIVLCENVKERRSFTEALMKVHEQLDSIHGVLPIVHEAKSAVNRDLVRFIEAFDILMKGRITVPEDMCLLCFIDVGRACTCLRLPMLIPEIIQERKNAAASEIQRIFRGYLVRRTRPMKHLLIIKKMKRELAQLKIQVGDPKRAKVLRENVNERRRFTESLMKMHEQLDSIQAVLPIVRAARRAVNGDLSRFIEAFDIFINRTMTVPENMCLLCCIDAGRTCTCLGLPEIMQKRKNAAASEIQRVFRGYLVRKSRTMEHLLIIQSVERELVRLKIQVWDSERVKVLCDNVKEGRRFTEALMKMHEQLDSIQDVLPIFREAKSAVNQDLSRFIEAFEVLIKRTMSVPEDMCLMCFIDARRACTCLGLPMLLPEIIQKRKDAAALKIQRVLRGYLVRRTRPMKYLLIIQRVKRELARLKIQVWDPKRARVLSENVKERRHFTESFMKMHEQLDNIQGDLPIVREAKRAVDRELSWFIEVFDVMIKSKNF